jgi:3-phosphoshikimate 1-carboxyvinyltransferase
MNIQISPSTLVGTLSAISSKSDAHRTMIAAALAETPTKIRLNVFSKDMEATANCIKAFGCAVKAEQDESGTILTIVPVKTKKPSVTLDCFESGSTARFLLPVASVLCDRATLVGQGRLPERPFSPLTKVMRLHGCEISSDYLPMTTNGKLTSGKFEIEGNISSQYITGLLFALPLLSGDSELKLLSPLESEGYVEMTIRTLNRFGIVIQKTDCGYFIKGNQPYLSPGEMTIEGDWSNSAFWICAGAISGEISVKGLALDSLQGDKEICSLISRFGGMIETENDTVNSKPNSLSAIEIDAANIPDLVPILAVVAAVSNGKTVIKNAGRLRMKESDRLMTVCTCLRHIGADITETADGLMINGKKRLSGGTADSFNDHRIAMSLAIAGTVCEKDVLITNAQAVEKSYPHFFEDFKKIGGTIRVI